MKSRILAFALLALGFGSSAAFGQAFPNYPTIGVPADTECMAYGNYDRCTSWRPAGPNILPGTATIPADTNYPNGANPQTVRIPAALLGASSVQASPLTGTVVNAAGAAKVMLSPAGTIATLTVQMPAPVNGQTFAIYTTQTVTALTLTPSAGTTITPSVTTVTAAAPVKLIYNGGSKAWVTQ